MRRVLIKRYPRELKKNFFRYFSLFVLIIICMFLVVAIVDASYSIIEGTKENQKISRVEDCQAILFTPLTAEQIKIIEDKGVCVEAHNSFDYQTEDGKILRIFKDREKIDLVIYDEGRKAQGTDEIALLNRFCAENDISLNDTIRIGSKDVKVVGIVSSVDYDAAYKNLADTAVDNLMFSTAFVSDEFYDILKKNDNSSTEEYTYAFILNDALTADELKKTIKDFEFDYKDVEDEYYIELLSDTYGKKEEIEDGINELNDGVSKLYDGIGELNDGVKELKDGTVEFKDGLNDIYEGSKELSDASKELKDAAKELDDGASSLNDGAKKLNDGAGELFKGTTALKDGIVDAGSGADALSAGLNEIDANSSLIDSGALSVFNTTLKNVSDSINSQIADINAMTGQNIEPLELSRENYSSELNKFAALLQSFGIDSTSVTDAKAVLDGINNYVSGTEAYTNGVKEAAKGAKELNNGMQSAASGAKELTKGSADLYSGCAELYRGTGELKEGTDKFKDATGDLYEGSKELSDANKEAMDASIELDEGVGKLKDGTEELKDGIKELKDGVEDLKDRSDEMLDEIFTQSPDNIMQFMLKEENIRIGGAAGDVEIDGTIGMFAGVIVLILLTYVMSVFVIHQIQNESSVIGALYSLGAKKSELISHYIFIPTMISLVAGVIGGSLGMSRFGCRWQMMDMYNYFSIPYMPCRIPFYLVIYSAVMPALVAFFVNYIVVNKNLSRTALSLLRNEQKVSTGKDIRLGRMKFINKYRIRQIFRERRTAVTVVAGMFISLLIFMLGMDCAVLCSNIGVYTEKDMHYQYMYTYKYPTKEAPKGGEACFVKSLKKEQYGYSLDVAMIGMDDDNPYFDFDCEKGQNKLTISDSVSKRYNVKEGDKLILSDNSKGVDHAFTVDKVVPYSVGLTVFMDIESMRELFDEDDDYYNVVLSDKQLDIEEGRLYSMTDKTETRKAADVFVTLMRPMVIMLIVMSAIMFCLVLYLMVSVMIDRAGFGISLLKIFGYNNREIKKLYLDGNRIVVFAGALISVPISKFLIDILFPSFIANVACAIHLEFEWYVYLAIIISIMALYEIINFFLSAKFKKISEAEVLKNRE